MATLVLAPVPLLLAVACGDEQPDAVEFINLRVEAITASSAVVRFDTSRPTTCEVEYGLEVDALDGLAEDPSMGEEAAYAIEHEVPLFDLLPETTYYYRGRATDVSGVTYRAEILSFTTTAGQSRPPNLALLAAGSSVVDVSSNFGGGDNASTWGANNAFDGLSGTEWASNGDGDNAFVELELPAPTTITGFGFQSRRMPDDSSIITGVELVLNDGDTRLGPFETPDYQTFYEFEIDAVTAERIRFEVVDSTGGNTGAKEIEIYGE